MAQAPSKLNKPTPEIPVVEIGGKEIPIAKKFWAWFGALGGIAGNWDVSGTLTAPVGGILGSNPLLHVREEQPNGTDGGDATNGAWRTRVLNTTLTGQIAGGGLAVAPAVANQVLLPAGTYWAFGRSPALRVDRHRCKLADITAGVDIVLGGNAQTAGGDSVQTDATVSGQFTLTVPSVVELQYRVTTTTATGFGLGISSNFGDVEVYAELMIWQLEAA